MVNDIKLSITKLISEQDKPPYEPDWKIWSVRPLVGVPGFLFRVQGTNRNVPVGGYGHKFIWDIPDLKDGRFDLSEAVLLPLGGKDSRPGRCDNVIHGGRDN